MINTPLVSVVMSVYNAENYIAEAIESILEQSYENFEFIIINDGSTDESLSIITEYKDVRIRIVSRENRGLIESLNEGILLAQGKYIARMDADDISLASRFEKQVSFLEKHQDIGICGTAVMGFGKQIESFVWRLPLNDKRLKAELLFSSCFAHPTVMMRREMLLHHALYYDKQFLHAEDLELWTRMARYTHFANLKMPLLKYRIVENSITRKADKNIEKRYQTIQTIFKQYLKELHVDNTEEENRLHFNLSINERMRDNEIGFDILSYYFFKLIKANTKYQKFDSKELKKVLGKKWLWNMYYRKNIAAMFSKYFLYGVWSMIKK